MFPIPIHFRPPQEAFYYVCIVALMLPLASTLAQDRVRSDDATTSQSTALRISETTYFGNAGWDSADSVFDYVMTATDWDGRGAVAIAEGISYSSVSGFLILSDNELRIVLRNSSTIQQLAERAEHGLKGYKVTWEAVRVPRLIVAYESSGTMNAIVVDNPFWCHSTALRSEDGKITDVVLGRNPDIPKGAEGLFSDFCRLYYVVLQTGSKPSHSAADFRSMLELLDEFDAASACLTD